MINGGRSCIKNLTGASRHGERRFARQSSSRADWRGRGHARIAAIIDAAEEHFSSQFKHAARIAEKELFRLIV